MRNRHPQNQPFNLTTTARIKVRRAGREIPVSVRQRIDFDGTSWGGSILRVYCRHRRIRLTYREVDRAWFAACAAVA